MKKRLTIGTPCHEDWNKMIPNSEGRHCEVCDKTVVDLTAKSQTEMIALFEEMGGDMCGRMEVAVPSKPAPGFARPALRGRLRKFALALLAAFGLLSWNEVAAQSRPLPGKVAYHATYDLKAMVFSEGRPLRGATVQVKVDRVVVREVRTDEQGVALFQNLEPGSYTVVVRHENQKVTTRQIELQFDDQLLVFEVVMENGAWQEEPMKMLGDMAIVLEDFTPMPPVEVDTIMEVMMGTPTIEPVVIDPVKDEFLQPVVECVGNAGESNRESTGVVAGTTFKVFPNPMEGRFVAEINGTETGSAVHLIVFDEKGREVTRMSHPGGGDLLLEMNLGEVSSGIYFVKVIHGQFTAEKRVVKL